MRKLLTATPLVALLLSGCATTSSTDVVKYVQDGAVVTCAFLPTAATVSAILAGIPDYSTAINAICDAVTNKGGRRGVGASVNGIPVEGHFVRGRHRGASVNGVEIHGRFVR